MKTISFSISIIAMLLFGLVSSSAIAQEKINWISMEELEVAQEKEKKKVLIDVYTKWCGPCKMMMRNTFSNPDIIKYVNENYYAVKFDAEGPSEFTFKGQKYANPSYDPNKHGRNGTHQFTMAIAPVNGRVAYPTIVYLDEEFQIISPVQGYLAPNQIWPILNFIDTDSYKNVSWQDYQKTFNTPLKSNG